MINFKRIIYDIVVTAALAAALVAAAPAPDKPCHHGEADKVFDQRQNGSENYRLNIDGVVIAVAPADSLLAAASEIDLADLLDLDELNEIQPKPKPPTVGEPEKPSDKPDADKPVSPAAAPAVASEEPSASKSAHGKAQKGRKKGLKLRLANLLLPLLKKSRQRHH